MSNETINTSMDMSHSTDDTEYTTNESLILNDPNMSNVCMLSTHDNPYNPFEQFDQWFLFDVEKGYNSCSRVARIANFTDDMTQKEIDEETERAIDEIIKYDFMDVYKKVTKNNSTSNYQQ